MRMHVAGGRLIDPASSVDAVKDIWITDGVIVGIGAPPAGFEADERVEATGRCVLPGLVDLSYDPGCENDWQGALAGGITTVAVSIKAEDALSSSGTPESASASPAIDIASHRSGAPRILAVAPMCSRASDQQLSDFGRLRHAGCIAWSAAAIGDTQLLWRAMQYARGLGGALWLPPVDAALARGGVAGAGAYAARLGLESVPVVAETVALARIFALQRDTGARVHLSHLTSAEGVALVRDARREGLPVTCDVAAHHLHVIDLDIGFYDPRYRLDPPLRGSRDRDALRAGLADGTIDAVCSHHDAVASGHADAPFASAAAGAADGPLLASLVLKWARETGVAPLQALAKITTGPAAVIAATQPALPRAGRLEVGVPADFCVFDIDDFWLVPDGQARASGANTAVYGRTPFSGMPMTGRVTATYIHGECVWRAAQ